MPAESIVRAPRLVALALLAVLGSSAAAGPPEGVSGRMAFDDVADGLRKYRKENDDDKRLAWLKKLAPARDPRVAVALGEALSDHCDWIVVNAWWAIEAHYNREPLAGPYSSQRAAWRWWNVNEADLRRRAKELPR
jgi:hypothetical protein